MYPLISCSCSYLLAMVDHLTHFSKAVPIQTTQKRRVAGWLSDCTALVAQPDLHNWAPYLPHVLLSIRNMIKQDSGCSPAELTFENTLRLPEDLIYPNCHSALTPREAFRSQLKTTMSQIAATPPRQHSSMRYEQKSRSEARCVFDGHNVVRKRSAGYV